MMANCNHPHGAQVDPLMAWVCGRCYKKLPERPKRYGMAPHIVKGGYLGARYDLIWQAELKVADGLTLADFLRTMAKRIKFKSGGGMQESDAYDFAIEFLETLGEEFGDPALDWSHEGAREMADELLSEWDAAPGDAENEVEGNE